MHGSTAKFSHLLAVAHGKQPPLRNDLRLLGALWSGLADLYWLALLRQVTIRHSLALFPPSTSPVARCIPSLDGTMISPQSATRSGTTESSLAVLDDAGDEPSIVRRCVTPFSIAFGSSSLEPISGFRRHAQYVKSYSACSRS